MTATATRTLSLIAGLALLAGCGGRADPPAEWSLGGPTMGTTYRVVVQSPPRAVSRQGLRDGIESILHRIDARMSTYDPDSELSRFNAAERTEWQPVSAELAGVVRRALAIAARTGGAYDPSVGRLVELWGFGAAPPRSEPPADGAVAAAQRVSGFEQVEARQHPPALRKTRPDLALDLSGIAKGHAVDAVADYLGERGIEHYLVDIGGELRVSRAKVGGEAWRIAVERPTGGSRAVERVLALRDRGMATSGDYRNYFEHEGKRYAHIIDPRTGRPAEHDLASVTVVCPTAAEADALATGLLVMGAEAGMRFAESHEIPAYFIARDGDGWRQHASPAWESAVGQPGSASP